jgi:signal transduction histidine kinase
MTRVVEQLLTLMRQEPGAPGMVLQPVDLAALAHDAIARHVDLASAKGIDLGATALDVAHAQGDAAALGVLLDNLLENAIRYTPSGGRVDVAVGNPDGRPTLEVLDSGPGIAPAERPHVFDRFWRGHAAREPGSGLGLAIVRAIADRHGAQIDLGESRLGGLSVRVVLAPPEAREPASG